MLHDREEQIMEIRGGKRYRTRAERREIVEETLKAGASVSAVARAHEVNANQVFEWRRQYRQGLLEENRSATALVPIQITTAVKKPQVSIERASKSKSSREAGSIEIDLGNARVRIEGAADPECVRVALEGLIR
jgi:transposase